ncbi:hypothetical protein [Hydrogenobaculum acidophilum]
MDRRSFIKLIAIGFIPFISKAYELSALETKSAVKYQSHPHDGEMCCMCKFFIPSGYSSPHPCHMGMMGSMGMMGGGMMNAKCQVVAGRISPMGWCVLFQRA